MLTANNIALKSNPLRFATRRVLAENRHAAVRLCFSFTILVLPGYLGTCRTVRSFVPAVSFLPFAALIVEPMDRKTSSIRVQRQLKAGYVASANLPHARRLMTPDCGPAWPAPLPSCPGVNERERFTGCVQHRAALAGYVRNVSQFARDGAPLAPVSSDNCELLRCTSDPGRFALSFSINKRDLWCNERSVQLENDDR